jgi:hypothetical protein
MPPTTHIPLNVTPKNNVVNIFAFLFGNVGNYFNTHTSTTISRPPSIDSE